jgi:hypothetical protein
MPLSELPNTNRLCKSAERIGTHELLPDGVMPHKQDTPYNWLWTKVGTLLSLTSTKLIDCYQLCESNLHIYHSWIDDKKYLIFIHAEIFPKYFSQRRCLDEAKWSIFWHIQIFLFVELDSSKLNNYSTKTQQTRYSTTIFVFAHILLGLPIMFKPCGLAHLV